MKRKRVLIMIDTASRDALSQLLIARYVQRKGVRVLLCNQVTQVGMCERYRPDVLLTTWTNVRGVGEYLQRIRHKTRIVLVDQEGARLGEEAFRRTMAAYDRAKCRVAAAATRVIAWGPLQARWITEQGCIGEERIVVTGCPRLDPYLVPAGIVPHRPKYVGVTLRADPVTSLPARLMEGAFESLSVNPHDGLSFSLPLRAKFEDAIWEALAVTRHMFQVVVELSKRTRARIVLRPGPWELPEVYGFLPKRMPRVSIEPMPLQHEYVKNAFVTVDDTSTLGIESLLAGTPVVSLNRLVQNLGAHVGGEGGTRFNAPFKRLYWMPGTLDEAVDAILRAERGELDVTPAPEDLRRYVQDHFAWPVRRPASFTAGEMILELLDLPRAAHLEPYAVEALDGIARLKRAAYRLPGSTHLARACYGCCYLVGSRYRKAFHRYHYFHALYPNHRGVNEVFNALWRADGSGALRGEHAELAVACGSAKARR